MRGNHSPERERYMKKKAINAVYACLMLTILSMASAGAFSQEVRLRKGDRLELNVPDRQELGRVIEINSSGNVVVPVIGIVHLEGLTIKEAEASLLRKMRELYPGIGFIKLTLIGEESRKLIYVHGQVLHPGKYELQGSPNVWEAVREAGGATPDASLDAVRLIRAKGARKRTEIVNLQEAIDTGDFSKLPALKPGDTIIVPTRAVRQFGTGAVNVIGAVVNPAPYMLNGEKRLVDAILAAGGPSENANLHNVIIIRKLNNGGTMTIKVDFDRYLEKGDIRDNPVVKPDDTVSIPKYNNYFRTMFTDPRFLLGLMTAAGTLATVLITR